MHVAKKIRQEKETESWRPQGAPRTYCRAPDCLFRISTRRGYVACPRHPALNPECERSEATGVRVRGTEASVESAPRPADRQSASRPTPLPALPDSRPHPDDCRCHKCVFPF